MSEKKRIDPNATVQLDVGDLFSPEAGPEEGAEEEPKPSAAGHRRTAPPPLPPMMAGSPSAAPTDAASASVAPPSMAPAVARASTVPPRSTGRTAVLGVVFAVLLAAAILGGLFAGRIIRGQPTAPRVSATPPPAPPPATSDTAQPLTLPAVEITGH